MSVNEPLTDERLEIIRQITKGNIAGGTSTQWIDATVLSLIERIDLEKGRAQQARAEVEDWKRRRETLENVVAKRHEAHVILADRAFMFMMVPDSNFCRNALIDALVAFNPELYGVKVTKKDSP